MAFVDPFVDPRLDRDLAVLRPHLHDVARLDPEIRRVVGMDLEPVAREQLEVARPARHRADVVVLQSPSRDEDQRVLVACLVARLLVGEGGEAAPAVRERE